jgi:hypothetical protein
MDSTKRSKGKKPRFLAINAKNFKQAQTSVLAYITAVAEYLIAQDSTNKDYQCTMNSQCIEALLGSLTTDYKFPHSLHVTTCYLAKSPDAAKHLRAFEEGITVPIVVYGLAISPGHIITGICRHEDYPVEIENKVLLTY